MEVGEEEGCYRLSNYNVVSSSSCHHSKGYLSLLRSFLRNPVSSYRLKEYPFLIPVEKAELFVLWLLTMQRRRTMSLVFMERM
jgi:hypothetical protein